MIIAKFKIALENLLRGVILDNYTSPLSFPSKLELKAVSWVSA